MQPPGGPYLSPTAFFQQYLAALLILVLYLFWKIFSSLSRDPKVNYRGWKLFLRKDEIDIWTGIRPGILLSEEEQAERRAARHKMTMLDRILYIPKNLIFSLFV